MDTIAPCRTSQQQTCHWLLKVHSFTMVHVKDGEFIMKNRHHHSLATEQLPWMKRCQSCLQIAHAITFGRQLINHLRLGLIDDLLVEVGV